jgi:hypothetical protein
MSRPSGTYHSPLRLVQLSDDDNDDVSDTTSLIGTAQSPSLRQLLRDGSSASTVHLASFHTQTTRRGKLSGEGQQRHIAAHDVLGIGSPPLPAFPTHEQRKADKARLSSTSSVHEDQDTKDLVSNSARSSPGPASKITSSVDRLAALYQQYQLPLEGKSVGDLDVKGPNRQVYSTETPTPPPPLPLRVSPTESAANSRRRVGGSERREHGTRASAASVLCSADVNCNHATGTEAESQELFRTPHPSCLVTPAMTAAPTLSIAAGAAERSTISAFRSPQRQRQQLQQGLPIVALPASLSESGVSGLMNTAIYVWAPLGFFEMRPNENTADGDDVDSEDNAAAVAKDAQSMGSSAAQEVSDVRDVETFLFVIEDFLSLFCAEATATVSSDTLAAYTALMRNGLWRVLFNAVFYCVSVLDAHRRRRGPLSGKEREVRSGGPEDAYEVVFPSSSSADDEGGEEASVEREVPVRLTWRVCGESEEARASRCAREPLPSDSPLRAGGPPYRSRVGGARRNSDAYAGRLRGGKITFDRRAPPLDLFGGRLRAPLRVSDWYFTLRCMAQVGYRRDTFYLQTPSSAVPFELFLALLWLTQQYKLLGVAEYVELNRRYGFLLQYHVEDSFWRGAATQQVQTRERLLHHFSNASVWPPISFDENSAIRLRLAQLERCLGRSASPTTPSRQSKPSETTLQVRRLMAVKRLISLSLNRLHHALQRQAEQTALLGLHSPLDAQLCRKEHHDLYEEVMAGLTYVQETERRLRAAAEGLSKAGSLVAFLLRYDESCVSAEDVLLGLEEDDATWLDNVDDNEGKGRGGGADAKVDASGGALREQQQRQEKSTRAPKETTADRWCRAVRRGALPTSQHDMSSLPTSAAALAQSLSTFRATQSRASLTETWKRLLRRGHVAPDTISPENLRFLLDTEAQQVQEARVRENMKSRYSLQAALAAELAVLGYEKQQRRHQRSQSRSPLRRESKMVNESVSSRHTADADADKEACLVRVALPSMELVTNAATTFAQLQAEEEAYGPVTLSTAELQLTAVGVPAAGSTTSARLELERLKTWEVELDEQLGAQTQTEARVAHCKKILETLYHQFGLRMATPVVPPKTP